jgi:hypothetical protein
MLAHRCDRVKNMVGRTTDAEDQGTLAMARSNAPGRDDTGWGVYNLISGVGT